MKIIGLTGGIGSGKSTVAKMFAKLGAPVYIADIEAKQLMNTSADIKKKLINLLGDRTYNEGVLDRKYVASLIFNNTALLEKMNSIIHPEVRQHFKIWVKKQQAPYCIKEVAILFENGSYTDCDITILIVAPQKVRIQRVMLRDNVEESDVKARIKNQWSDAKKKKLADIIINNENLQSVEKRVLKLHQKFIG